MMIARVFVLLLAFSNATSFLSPSGSSRIAFRTAMATKGGDSNAPEVKVGDKLSAVDLVEGKSDFGTEEFNLASLISGKKVAIFGLPGAFTPGCSKSHLPSFMEAQKELKAKGVELTICLATNDAYVMEAWGRTSGGSDAGILFLSDANGELTKSLGLVMDGEVMLRTKRFSLIADNCVVTHYFGSADDSANTFAPSVLAAL